MDLERTLSILKPDAIERYLVDKINARFEKAGITLIAQKSLHMTHAQAAGFYAVHKERPFFYQLCQYMSQGPVLVQVLEGQKVIEMNRQLMGHTDPAKAEKGTIRYDFGQSIERNTVHGSDAVDTAQEEIAFFFSQIELIKS